MVNWFDNIKLYYERGNWDDTMVKKAVAKGKITPSQYKEITGKEYTE